MSETRAVANLPNLNIEILHTRGARGRVPSTCRSRCGRRPTSPRAVSLLDPFRLLGARRFEPMAGLAAPGRPVRPLAPRPRPCCRHRGPAPMIRHIVLFSAKDAGRDCRLIQAALSRLAEIPDATAAGGGPQRPSATACRPRSTSWSMASSPTSRPSTATRRTRSTPRPSPWSARAARSASPWTSRLGLAVAQLVPGRAEIGEAGGEKAVVDRSVWPVMPSTVARKRTAAATSSGALNRPSGVRSRSWRWTSASSRVRAMVVLRCSTMPGPTRVDQDAERRQLDRHALDQRALRRLGGAIDHLAGPGLLGGDRGDHHDPAAAGRPHPPRRQPGRPGRCRAR